MYRNCLFLLCLTTAPALAQWSSNPAVNFALDDGPNDQVQRKVAPTSDGGCYVSWYDNSLGGYDVTIQRLDAAGNELWPHVGIQLVDRSVSSTTDYALVTCANGDALITYLDNRSGSNQIAVQRVSPAGALLFGPDGVIVSSGTGVSGNSRIAELSDIAPGDVVVSRHEWSLYLNVRGTQDVAVLDGWYFDPAGRIERVEFADGTVWDGSSLEASLCSTYWYKW